MDHGIRNRSRPMSLEYPRSLSGSSLVFYVRQVVWCRVCGRDYEKRQSRPKSRSICLNGKHSSVRFFCGIEKCRLLYFWILLCVVNCTWWVQWNRPPAILFRGPSRKPAGTCEARKTRQLRVPCNSRAIWHFLWGWESNCPVNMTIVDTPPHHKRYCSFCWNNAWT